MKASFLLLFFIFCSLSHAQTNQVVFELSDNNKTYNLTNCLNNLTDDVALKLKITQGNESMIQSFQLVAFLDANFSITFTDYTKFSQTELIGLLSGNNAFQNFTSITFTIDITLQNQQKETQTIKVCMQKVASQEIIASSGNSKKEFIEIPVSFATDRNDTKNTDLNERFGGNRSELQYGRIVVSVPNTHTLGEIERPSYWRLEFSEDPSKHMMMQSLKKQNKDDFFNQMKQRIAKNGKSTFLFVHGYNVSFADAAFRTAQITFDLRFSGEAVFYSWPSQASTTSYTVDEANIEWATYNMKNFLKDYLTKTDAKNIYLVAHSMGNRGLTKALIELMNEHPELKNKITEIILAAPDIDADVFKRDIGPKMISKIGKPITLYVSSDDLALMASKKVHGSYRAGEAGAQILVLKGIETIDASGQDASFLSHSYFATTSNLIKDIFDLMKSGKRATDRETLETVSKANVQYWKVKKGQE
jgi:esterase/lipase superfamily enzyme